MLAALVDNRTDKHTVHSYLEVYEALFSPIRDTASHVLEIGICDGGSIKLWNDYFTKAKIHGIDVQMPLGWLRAYPRVRMYEQDAYSDVARSFFPFPLDVIIDDGPHTLESMKHTATHYTPLLSPQGILVIEDIQSPGWIPHIVACFPEADRRLVQVYDRRHVKGRYDDIMIVLNRHPSRTE